MSRSNMILFTRLLIISASFATVSSFALLNDTEKISSIAPEDEQRGSGKNIVQIVVAASRVRESNGELESRLSQVLSDAYDAALHAKYELWTTADEGSEGDEASREMRRVPNFTAKIVRRDVNIRTTTIHFIAIMNGAILPAEPVSKDLSLLSLQHISAVLRLPVIRVHNLERASIEEASPWWTIGLIVGGGALLLILGWCILFVYFNTCAKYKLASGLDGARPEGTKEAYVQHVDTVEEEDANEAVDDHTQIRFASDTLQRESDTVAGEEMLVETDETYERAMEQTVNEVEERRHEGVQKADSLEIEEIPGEDLEHPEDASPSRSNRPKTARPRRPIRGLEGPITSMVEGGDVSIREWNTFRAGDRVNQLFSIRPACNSSYDQPTPSEPTVDGIIALSTKTRAPSDFSFNRIL